MNNSAMKVSEIFEAAGKAFNSLGEMTMQLHQPSDSPSASKWTDEEIEMLHASINRFTEDLNKVSLIIKNRTVSQIRQTLKKKVFEEAGIPVKQIPVQQMTIVQTIPQQQSQIQKIIQSQSQQQIQQVLQIPQQQQTQIIGNVNDLQQELDNQQQQQMQVVDDSNNSVILVNQKPNDVKMTLSRLNTQEMTLNRLNTQENEVDVEELQSEVKLDFAGEEVAG